MTTRTKLVIALTTALGMIPLGQAVAGVGFTAGDWKVDLSGNVNGFYVNSNCDSGGAGTTVAGGLACVGDNSGSVRNGLLPAAIVFSISGRQDNLDVGVTIGLYPGINSSLGGAVNTGGGNPAALQSPGIDARQAFFTFGDSSWGSVKIGRDIGLFAKDAILDDMTLLGVGSAGGNAAPSNTSLGRIGIGYIYTDWEPQITYTSPSYNGFGFSAGVFQPLNSLTDGYTKHTSPQFQVGANYAWGDPKTDTLTGKVWVDVVSQRLQATDAQIAANPTAPSGFTGTAFDGGVKIDYADFEAVLYGYSGKGVGTTGLYVLPVAANGEKRDSDGGYLQLSYKFGKLKVGASYGISDLKLASGEASSDLVKRNKSGVFGLYYSLTKSVTLVGEFSDTKADAQDGNSAQEKDVIVGGIVFF
jgi:predicted porin